MSEHPFNSRDSCNRLIIDYCREKFDADHYLGPIAQLQCAMFPAICHATFQPLQGMSHCAMFPASCHATFLTVARYVTLCNVSCKLSRNVFDRCKVCHTVQCFLQVVTQRFDRCKVCHTVQCFLQFAGSRTRFHSPKRFQAAFRLKFRSHRSALLIVNACAIFPGTCLAMRCDTSRMKHFIVQQCLTRQREMPFAAVREITGNNWPHHPKLLTDQFRYFKISCKQ